MVSIAPAISSSYESFNLISIAQLCENFIKQYVLLASSSLELRRRIHSVWIFFKLNHSFLEERCLIVKIYLSLWLLNLCFLLFHCKRLCRSNVWPPVFPWSNRLRLPTCRILRGSDSISVMS